MGKIDKNLKNAYIMTNHEKSVECLVYYNDLKKAESFLIRHNIEVCNKFPFISALAICIPYLVAQQLARQDFVEFLSSTTMAFAMVDVSKKIIGADCLSPCENKITVAVIDTGICPHLDFVVPTNRIKKFVDLVDEKDFPYDDNGHGTFVAGVLAGNGLVSNRKYQGIFPDCDIISIKALNSKGEGSAVNILSAMQWIYDNHEKYNIKVVCMSFGSEPLGHTDPIMKGADKLWSKGIIVVAAAGNSGPKFGTIKSPGISSKIITVGGMNDCRDFGKVNKNDFFVADFSSRGPALGRMKPDCIAPSVDIVSCSKKSHYTSLSGTSVATPMIAGVCAKILSINPKLSPDQVKRFLIKNCTSIISGGISKRNIEGFGFPEFKK